MKSNISTMYDGSTLDLRGHSLPWATSLVPIVSILFQLHTENAVVIQAVCWLTKVLVGLHTLLPMAIIWDVKMNI